VRKLALSLLAIVLAGFGSAAAWPATFGAAAGPRLPSNDLDATFGHGGVVITHLPSTDEAIQRLAIQSDGKIVALGSRNSFTDFVVLRYGPNGRQDPTFHPSVHLFGDALAVQPDQKIVIAGTPGGFLDLRFALDRLNPDGTVDLTFGRHGEVTTQFPLDARLEDVTVQPDGKLVAAGEIVGNGAEGFVFARYLSNGRLDPTFGSSGIESVELTMADHVLGQVAVQPDGKIVANGYVSQNPTLLGMVRLEEDGTLDPTFGDAGVVIMTEFENFTTSSLALQEDGGILSSGIYYNSVTTRSEFGLVRHLPDGRLDLGFGEGGLAHLDVAGLASYPEGLALQPNGLIVQAGLSPNEGDEQEVDVVWWEPNGSLHSEVHSGLFGVTSFGNAVVVQDEKAVVGGSGSTSYADQKLGLARFLSS
jgi:uncharacterized delta-60 repeat protein